MRLFSRSPLEGACPEGCRGYELNGDLDFEDSESHASGAVKTVWTTGEGWLPIGTEEKPFTARFEGNNHVIAKLSIERIALSQGHTNPAGLFGFTGETAIIRIVALIQVDVASVFDGNGHTISNLYSTGLIHRNPFYYETGIAGFFNVVEDESAIRNIGILNVGITGERNVGGLAGRNEGEITNSFVSGKVSGREAVGGPRRSQSGISHVQPRLDYNLGRNRSRRTGRMES